MNRFFRSALFPLIVIVLLVYLASQTLMGGAEEREEGHVLGAPAAGERDQPQSIEQIVLDPNKQRATTELKGGEKFNVNYPSNESLLELERTLKANDVTYDSKGTRRRRRGGRSSPRCCRSCSCSASGSS